MSVAEAERPWQLYPLSEVTEKADQVDPRSSPDRLWTYIDVSSVSNQSLSIETPQNLRGADAPSRARKRVKAGDTIVATVRPYLRRIAQVPDELDGEVCSTAFCVLRAQHGVLDPDYLYFAVLSNGFMRSLTELQRGSGYPAVSDRDVLAQKISLPDLDEQQAIAHVLRTVQRAREQTDQALGATVVLKQSLEAEAFRGTLLGMPSTDRLETRIGSLPSHWEVVQVGDIAKSVQYGISRRGTPDGRVAILGIRNVNQGRVQLRGVGRVDVSPEELSKFRLEAGDLLFTRTNSFEKVGDVALFDLDDEFIFASYLLRIQLDRTKASPRYIAAYLASPGVQHRLRRLASRAVGQANINATKLKSFDISVPPLKEQDEIVRVLSVVDQKIAAEEQGRAALDELFKTLLDALITRKGPVKALLESV